VKRLVILVAIVFLVLAAAVLAYIAIPPGTSVQTTSTSSGPSTSSTGIGCVPESGSTASEWTTYHGDNSRSGYASFPATCAKADWMSKVLDGEVYAEPLVYDGMVFVATENDSLYAINSSTGAIVWRTNVGKPVQGSALPCGDISPSGITGTPVIDPTTNTIYAVAFEAPGMHYLIGLDTTNGRLRFSVLADPPQANPLVQQERGALTLSNGMVYVPYGGLFGDCGQYHGWLVGMNIDGNGNLVSYQVPTAREGGIWAPSGAVVNSAGDLFVATGNGASDSTFDHGDSVIELSPTLRELGYFAPSNWQQLNQGDTDLGSVGPVLVEHDELFQIGKEGVGYLVNSTSLGGIGGEVFSGQVCSSAYGGTASSGNLVFVPCTDGLVALSLAPDSFEVLWRSPNFPAGPPIVTGNVVWVLDTSNGTLHGYNANTGEGLLTFSTGPVTRFTTPSTGDARVFVAAGSRIFSFVI
jgi:outer membrane protein assembly factor BamB